MAMASFLPSHLHPQAPLPDYLDLFDAPSLDLLHDSFLTGQDFYTTVVGLQQQQKQSSRRLGWSGATDPTFLNFTAALVTTLSTSASLREVVESRNRNKLTISEENGSAPPALPTLARPPGQGRLCKLPVWLAELKESSQLSKILTAAIESGPVNLAANKNGVMVSSSIDFGIKRAGWSNKEMPAIPFDRPTPRFFRSLTVANKSLERLVIVDICGIPEIDDVFILHDDYNIGHHHKRGCNQEEEEDIFKAGVTLQPGDEYQVTVELRCSPYECSFHQQWLLFTLAKEDLHVEKMSVNNIFVIGRQISAFVAKHVQDVQTCLSVEAKPFFPAILRDLFDTPPVTFSIANPRPKLAFMECPVVYTACKQTTMSVWPAAFRQLEQALSVELNQQNAVKRQVKNHYCKLSDGNDQNTPVTGAKDCCPCFPLKLRQLSRLLALEEAAMNRDIKDFDLFNVHFVHHSQSLFELEVPGLPENRPSVFVGDVVYVRWVSYPTTECAAIVYAIESRPTPKLILRASEVFLSLLFPSGFQGKTHDLSEALQRERVHVRFTFDRLMFKRMHAALGRVARSSLKLLPCSCREDTVNTGQQSSLCNTLLTDSPNVECKSSTTTRPLKLENQLLNAEQQEALLNVLEGVSGCQPYIIFGPPGTGKTVTVVECVLQVIRKDAMARVCVCAPSNYAADILCSGIAAGRIGNSKMWRLNDPRRIIASVKTDVLPFCRYNTILGLFEFYPDPSSLQVIVCTCGAAGLLHEHPLSKCVGSFTHIFVDEAGQALIPEVLIPLSLGCENACRVLCGDPRQLGPVVHSKMAAAYGLSKSLLEEFMLCLQARTSIRKPASMTKLIRNYRANSKLLELPSRMFYNDELIAATKADVNPPKDWEELNGHDFPMLFYGVKGQQMQEGESPSLFNPVEATKVADLIEGLLKCSHVTVEDIGVMAPYRRQVQKIRLVLRLRHLGAVRVGTVDDYQGQEERIIFISTVLTRLEPMKSLNEEEMEQHIGFMRNDKRFNVAITRAKAMLVVVGHPLIISRDKNWSKLLQYCVMRDAFRGYGSHLFPAISRRTISPLDSLMHGTESSDFPEDDLEMSRAIEKLAELSLLGMGDRDRVYPDTLDAMYSACNEDLEWRVML